MLPRPDLTSEPHSCSPGHPRCANAGRQASPSPPGSHSNTTECYRLSRNTRWETLCAKVVLKLMEGVYHESLQQRAPICSAVSPLLPTAVPNHSNTSPHKSHTLPSHSQGLLVTQPARCCTSEQNSEQCNSRTTVGKTAPLTSFPTSVLPVFYTPDAVIFNNTIFHLRCNHLHN